MAVKNAPKAPQAAAMIDAADLSSGEPVTVHTRTTFQKVLGDGSPAYEPPPPPPSADELRECDWEINRLVAQGEQWIGMIAGKPTAAELHQRWGSGRYACYSMHPSTNERVGKPYIVLADPDGSYMAEESERRRGAPQYEPDPEPGFHDPDAAYGPGAMGAPSMGAGNPLAQMQLQIAQQAADHQRRMDKADFDRRDREDRDRDERREEDKRRERRSEKIMDMVMGIAATAIPAVITAFTRPRQESTGLNERVLELLAKQSNNAPPAAEAFTQAMGMMTSFEAMLERRLQAQAENAPEPSDKKESFMDMMMPMVMMRMMGAMPGGAPGAPGAAGGQPAAMLAQLAGPALRDPAMLKQLLANDRDGILRAVATVLQQDKQLAAEMMQELDKPHT